jgi:heme oxygenase
VIDNAPVSQKKLSVLLREATSASHIQLEQKMHMFRDGLTLPRYAALLNRWLSFLKAWEPAAASSFAQHGDFFSGRSKIELLHRDLAACNAEPSLLPCNLGPIQPTDDQTALGTLYVIEGSTLGGQIITPRVHEMLGLTPEHGSAFFNGYGRRTGEMWRETKSLIDQTTADRHARVVEKAAETFDFLGVWLTA